MRIPYGFDLIAPGVLEVNEKTAGTINDIFTYYLAGASLGKIVDMLFIKQIPSPTGNPRWTRAAVDKILSNIKYVEIVGANTFLQVQVEKGERCNVDYDKLDTPRKATRYVSPAILNL